MSPATRREIDAEQAPGKGVLEEVRAALSAGRPVAFPTETVYGIAARADSVAALEALRTVKGRDPRTPLTWHVADASVLANFEELPALVARLADRYWPGPLTLVLRGVPRGLENAGLDGWTGVRLPSHAATRSLLASLDFPVVMSSANRSGQPPLTTADEVAEAFGDELALVLDGGPARLAEASTILRVGRGHFELLREGLTSLADLRRIAGLTITFVCTGNTCRSPMAEALARVKIADRLGVAPGAIADFGFRVQSAGVFASAGAPASEHAVALLAKRDIDLSRHVSRPAIPEEIQGEDKVYCLTANHLEALLLALPPKKGANIELLDPEGRDVPDPIGGSLGDYQACAARIAEALDARITEWI